MLVVANSLRAVLGYLGGEGFGSAKLPLKALVRHFVVQKILGVNRGVSWPVHWTSKVSAAQHIKRGSRFPGLSMGCHIDGRNGIEFGNNVWVGPRVSIVSMNHDVNNYAKYLVADPIVIGDNCWLGAGCTILPGVKIGDHVVVAAGAVVTQSFVENNVVLAGVPAKVVKRLESYVGE